MVALWNGGNGLHVTMDVAKGWTRELSQAGTGGKTYQCLWYSA